VISSMYIALSVYMPIRDRNQVISSMYIALSVYMPIRDQESGDLLHVHRRYGVT
jgi:hypothetical protein